MKRLTKRTKAGTANIDYDGCTFPNGKEDYIAKSARRQLAIERFADIEDILCDDTDEYDLDRLSVLCNQRMTMRDEVSQRFSLTAKISLDRLRELAEADREGRCVVLPRLEPGQGDSAGEPGELGPAGVETAYREFAEDVIRQFGYHGSVNGRPAYTAGGLSTLEEAFRIVEWDDPHPAPECECQEEGCHEWATGGRPTPDGYKWLCSRHFVAYDARKEAEAALDEIIGGGE